MTREDKEPKRDFKMQLLIVLAAVFLCAQALPTQVGNEVQLHNATLFAARSTRGFGFASGTHGGAGGAVWTVWDSWALRDAVTGDAPRIIYVRGRIDLTQLFVGSPGVVVDVGSWKTIIGGDANAMIVNGGLRVRRAQHVIIQNIKFHNAISYAPGEQPNGSGGIVSQVAGEYTEVDAVLCEEAEYVWIDHNEFADDPWIANNIANDRMRHDGLVDIKRASNWVTVSHNIFRNHNKVMLIGHNDNNAAQDVGKLKTSIVANWFQGTTQRNPRVRYGEVHVVNNFYSNIGSYGIGAGAGASIYAERNAFISSRAWRHPDGVPSPIGNLLNVDNLIGSGSSFDAVPANVNWRPANYFSYIAIVPGNVEAHVRNIAGTW